MRETVYKEKLNSTSKHFFSPIKLYLDTKPHLGQYKAAKKCHKVLVLD